MGGGKVKLGNTKFKHNPPGEEEETPTDPRRGRHAGGGGGDTSLYFSSPDPDEVYVHLRSKGWTVKEPMDTSYGMRQVSTNDPDGFQLFFLCPADST